MKILIKLSLLTFALALNATGSLAQYESGVYRYGQNFSKGTSRNIAMGGGGITLGADISNLSNNPAGLAFYRSFDLSLSLGINDISNQIQYFGQKSENDRINFNLPNFGLVGAGTFRDIKGKEKVDGFTSYAYGFGYTRTNLFKNNYSFFGRNNQSSLSARFAENANEFNLQEGSIEEAAYFNYIINYDSVNNKFTPVQSKNVLQVINDSTNGNQNEINFSGALSISNKLFIGGAFQIVNVQNNYTYKIRESEIIDTVNNLSSFEYVENSAVTGTGFNFKLGLIYRPINQFRIAATYQSPTYLNMRDLYDVSVSSVFGKNDSAFNSIPLYYTYSFSYQIAPKYTVGAAYNFKKLFYIMGEIEFVNFGNSEFIDKRDVVASTNVSNKIASNYTSIMNYRAGAEYRLGMLYFRGGYSFISNPSTSAGGQNTSITSYSGGIGIKFEDYKIDIAYQTNQWNEVFNPYSTANHSPRAMINNSRNTFLCTFGVNF